MKKAIFSWDLNKPMSIILLYYEFFKSHSFTLISTSDIIPNRKVLLLSVLSCEARNFCIEEQSRNACIEEQSDEMARKGARQLFGLICSVCKNQNYVTEKNKTNTEGKLELTKYCKKCRKHTAHKETQKLK